MSQFRDALGNEEARTGYDVASQSFAEAFAYTRRKRDEIYRREGSLGVARAAWVPGGRSIAELAEGYEQLARRVRERRTLPGQRQESST